MTNATVLDSKALLQKALVELREMRSRLKAAETANSEPIAILGMGCRFPGANDPDAYWDLLHSGTCAIAPIPKDRWNVDEMYDPDPEQKGKCYARHGGYVQGIQEFDPQFFGVSPREARILDPQQRMLLEASWAAIEDAGISPESLYGSNTGVFVGVSSFEFALTMQASLEPELVDPYCGSGGALSPTAGRLSYVLGLTGPSMAVDTACSSSLVSVHLACQSLRRGECGQALAGGVNLLMAPGVHLAFCKARMLSPDGLCKTFDAGANGYVRGEGCGMVLLKPLSRALSDDDRILAVIRGSAVNQDGPSGGLTVPNGPSQQGVIRQALAVSGLKPEQVSYLEAHGTGTALGDPIELHSIASVFAAQREPLLVGSVKTNIGHLEGAAGIAGLIKVVLSLDHGEVPPHLHFQRPNPKIPWGRMNLEIPVQGRPWLRDETPRIAGVSSFGFSGTNAHVVVEEAPQRPCNPAGPDRPSHLLVLSAKTPEALREMAARYQRRLGAADVAAADACFTAATGRSHFAHRLAAIGTSCDELREKLAAFTEGRTLSGLLSDQAKGEDARRVAFVFPGEGSNLEAARELCETAPAFRGAIEECEVAYRRMGGCSILDPEPALFALQHGLLRLFKAWGIEPGAVAGEGVGECAAACAAGIFSMEDGLLLAAEHGRRSAQSGSARIAQTPPRIGFIKRAGSAAVAELAASGYQVSVELGLQATWAALLETLASLYVRGVEIDWRAVDAPYARRRVQLPTYPFQKQWCWPSALATAADDLAPDQWFYTETWKPADAPPHESAPPIAGDWLILADEAGMGRELAARLEAGGARCELAFPSEGGLARRLQQEGLTGIVHLWSMDGSARQGCGSVVELVREISALRMRRLPRLVLVTRGAQAVSDAHAPSPAAAALWGLGKVIAVENPELSCRLIDIDFASGARALAEELRSADGFRELTALRHGRRYVSRLVRLRPQSSAQVTLRPDATYLVTGGAGRIGLELVRWLAAGGAGHIVVASRNGAVTGLEHTAAQITAIRANVSDPAQVRSLIETIAASMPPLRGVFHCAGVMDPVRVAESDWPRFEHVLAPKLAGAWNLHAATLNRPLDYFVLFSSASTILPSPGLGSYAAANASLDALARHRRRKGLPALSVNWGPWTGTGMARAAANDAEAHWAAFGIDRLPPPKALAALGRMLSGGPPVAAVLDIRWQQAGQALAGATPPFLAEVLHASAPAPVGTRRSPVFQQLREMVSGRRTEFLAAHLQSMISEALHTSVALDANLTQLGMDSLMIMEVFNRLREDLQFVLYPREFYERPTIRDLAPYLSAEFERIHGPGEPASPATATVAPSETRLPPAAFILSSPRAGSTLLRVMLAGHPSLFVPPELHLLPFESMEQRKRELSLTHLEEGLLRAVMELDGCEAEAGRRLTEEWAGKGTSTSEIYRWLQQRAGSRLLIDKSPSYGMRRETLERAERLFAGAHYIHLVRHPAPVVSSFVRMRMDRLFSSAEVDSYQVAEQVWTVSNRNIRETLAGLGPERYLQVHYEDLVRKPRETMERICAFLGVPFDPALLTPYEGRRMTDGVYAHSSPIGDPNFHKHDTIDAGLAAAESVALPRELSGATLRLAAEMGYPMGEVAAPEGMRERTICTRGLNLCVCEWGAEDAPPVVLTHGILDQGASWEDVAAILVECGFHVIAPDLRGHGRSDHVGAGGSYRILDFVADLDVIVNELCAGGRFTLVGHSLGSIVAGMYAAARPERVGALVLVEIPFAGRENGGTVDTRRRLATQLDHLNFPAKHTPLPDFAAAVAGLRSAMPEIPEDVARRLAERATKPCESGLEWRWDPLLSTRGGIFFGREGAAGELRAVFEANVPITVVSGRESALSARTISLGSLAVRSNIRTAVVSGGHGLHIENPSALAKLIVEATQLREQPAPDAQSADLPGAFPQRLRSGFVWALRPLWEIPLAAASFLWYRWFRAFLRYGMRQHAARRTVQEWAALSADLMAVPWALEVFMTTGPRWNTHAIIASAGPFRVERILAIDADVANLAAQSWSLVIYSFPGNKTAASISSNASCRITGQHTVTLPPGRYSLGLRYYGWNRAVEFPSIAADGKRILGPALASGDVNNFYDDLQSKETWVFRWMHFYVFVILRLRRWLPRSFVAREFLPVGDPGTFFLYDYIRKGECLQFEIDARVLEEGPVYVTYYNRASFPVRWYRLTEARHAAAPMEQDGFYLVRVPGPQSSAKTLAAAIRVSARPGGRPAAWSAR
jgi:acyl transferase domain-containing protein/pimeloyl-ACP methyl ester carboxylesterase